MTIVTFEFHQLPVRLEGNPLVERCRVIGCDRPATDYLPTNIDSTRGKYIPVNVCEDHAREIRAMHTKKGKLRKGAGKIVRCTRCFREMPGLYASRCPYCGGRY